MSKKIKISLGTERVISMAPIGVREWGPWQFPSMWMGANKELFLIFHNAEDDYSGYGSRPKRYISEDLGLSWKETDRTGGFLLDNGLMIKPAVTKTLPLSEIELPEPIANSDYCYVKDAYLYDMDKVLPEHKKWYKWIINGKEECKQEMQVDSPGYLMRVSTGMLITPFFYNCYFYRKDKDSIIAVSYHPLHKNGETTTYFNALFFESKDNGNSFKMNSTIPYLPPYENAPGSNNFQGWLEPSLCFLSDGTVFALLRTTCVKGVSPSYISYSSDGLKTWSNPEYFDDRGVSPQAIQLENGIVLAGYGRPGLFVRAMYDGKWQDRISVVKPLGFQEDTCSYCALVAIDNNKALMVYSRFDVPDKEGNIRKAIMCREITADLV